MNLALSFDVGFAYHPPPLLHSSNPLLACFSRLFLLDRKTASLGEMIQRLTPLGVAVPGGFAVSSTAYDAVLDRFELRERLDSLLKDVDVTNLDDLADRGRQARQMIMLAGLPQEVRQEIE